MGDFCTSGHLAFKRKLLKGETSAFLNVLEKLYEFESCMFLPKGAAALTSKIRGQESSLNANGIYFKVGRDSERYVMVSGKAL